MPTFAQIITNKAYAAAEYWRKNNCKEDNATCYAYLWEQDYKKVIGTKWCAAFASDIINESCKAAGVRNPLPKLELSTHGYKNAAIKAGIRVDDKPAVGSVMFIDYGNNTGHVGIVVKLGATGIETVEGNQSNNITCVRCTERNTSVVVIGKSNNRTYQWMNSNNVLFIHTEEITGAVEKQQQQGAMANIVPLLAGVAIVGGLIYLNKN